MSIGCLGTNFSEILIKIQNFSFTKIHFKMSSVKWWPFCPRGDELNIWCPDKSGWGQTIGFFVKDWFVFSHKALQNIYAFSHVHYVFMAWYLSILSISFRVFSYNCPNACNKAKHNKNMSKSYGICSTAPCITINLYSGQQGFCVIQGLLCPLHSSYLPKHDATSKCVLM